MMKKLVCTLLALLSVILCGCTGSVPSERTFFALDTVVTLKIWGKNAAEALDSAQDLVLELDKLFDPDAEGSDIQRINSGAGGFVAADPRTCELLSRAAGISGECGGAFDITMGAVTQLWNFSGGGTVPTEQQLSSALGFVDYSLVEVLNGSVRIPENFRIDVGGIAKGYISGEVCRMLAGYGVAAVVDLGGNIQTVGAKPDGSKYTIAVQDPFDSGKYLRTLSLGESAVVTSGSYRRFFEVDGVKYHHILDPETGIPADSGLVSVTVICTDPTLADALSTAFFVMGETAAQEYCAVHSGVEAVFVHADGSVSLTSGAANYTTE